MTAPLAPEFAELPVPTPKAAPTGWLKQHVRRLMLRIAGIGASRRPDRGRPAKILLIRPDHLGDLLFLTPALRYLRELLPEAYIGLLAGPWGKAIVENNPHLNELLTCEFPGFTRQPKESVWQPYRFLYQQARLLKRHNFDTAVILRFDHWWGAWLATAAGIPRRVGYAIPEVQPFLTDALDYIPTRHEVEQNWHLLHQVGLFAASSMDKLTDPAGLIGPTEFFIPPEDQTWADGWLTQHGLVADKPLVIIHPGAGAVVKFWRPEAWAEVAQILINQHGCQILFSGSPAEVDLCRNIAARISPSPTVAAGQTTLAQLAGLMKRARLVVGPDTGPVKLAAAVGRPTLELYGPVDARKFGPWGDAARQRYITSRLGCIPCNQLDYAPAEAAYHFCVRGLSVTWVLQEVIELLKQR